MKRAEPQPEDFQRTRTPIAVMVKDFEPRREGAEHRHRRAQLIYAIAGTMRVTTPDGTWIVPPSHALWVPPRIPHAVATIGEVRMRTLYVEPELARRRRLPATCTAFVVSNLLRELISSAASVRFDQAPDARTRRLFALALDELRAAESAPRNLPIPHDSELSEICRAAARDPGGVDDVDRLAKRLGISTKTFARRFRAQTGMTFGAWLRQARLLEALTRLAAGEPVTAVALDLGYESPSAFTAMFRRAVGKPPRDYRPR